MRKVRPLYFLQLLKFKKIKHLYFFHFWPAGRRIINSIQFQRMVCGNFIPKPFCGNFIPMPFSGNFLLNGIRMKFRHNDVGILFPCYGVGTKCMRIEKVSIPKVCYGNFVPITDFVKYTFRRSDWFTTLNIKCAATALIKV